MTVNVSISLKLTVYLLTVVCLEKVLMTALDVCTGVGVCEGVHTEEFGIRNLADIRIFRT